MISRFTSFTRTALTVASLLAVGAAFAQTPLPPPDGPGAAPPATGRLAAPPQAGTLVSGRVQQWLLNPNGEADGLLLADGTQVVFAPHLSARLRAAIPSGGTVQVSGWRAPNVPVLRAMTITANGQSVTDTPPAPGAVPPTPREPGALAAMAVDGRIARVLYNDRGDIHGALLDNGTVVRFPPHVGAQYAALLQPGSSLFASGWGTRNAMGTALEATRLGQSASAANDVFGAPGTQPAPPVRPRGPGAPGAGGPRAAQPAPLIAPPAPASAS